MAHVINLIRHHGNSPRDGRERFNLLPRVGGHFLYAVGFSNGRTKIGKTTNPRKRVRCHWMASEGLVTWAHIFCAYADERLCLSIERDACRRAAEVSHRIRMTESFTGLSRDEALRCVRAAIREAQIGQ